MMSHNSCHLLSTFFCLLTVLSCFTGCFGSDADQDHYNRLPDLALHALFSKYGSNGTLTFEAFEHLLHNLGLRNIALDHGVDEHRDNYSSQFRVMHEKNHNHSLINTNLSDVRIDHSYESHDDGHHSGDIEHRMKTEVR